MEGKNIVKHLESRAVKKTKGTERIETKGDIKMRRKNKAG